MEMPRLRCFFPASFHGAGIRAVICAKAADLPIGSLPLTLPGCVHDGRLAMPIAACFAARLSATIFVWASSLATATPYRYGYPTGGEEARDHRESGGASMSSLTPR